jgi:integrase
MQVINGPRKHPRLPVPAIGSGSHCYRWAERHEIFKAAFQVTLDESSGFPFAYFLGLLMLAGLRVEEALRLHWEAPAIDAERWPWPDLKAWQIEIPDAKSGQGKRHVPIIPQLARLLTYWPRPKQGLLFPFRLESDQIANCWNETIKLAGVKRIGIPALRNTYALIMQDVFGLSPTSTAIFLGQLRRPIPKARPAAGRRQRKATA